MGCCSKERGLLRKRWAPGVGPGACSKTLVGSTPGDPSTGSFVEAEGQKNARGQYSITQSRATILSPSNKADLENDKSRTCFQAIGELLESIESVRSSSGQGGRR